MKKDNPNAIVFYMSEAGATNPYAKSYRDKKILPGTLLGIASGDNKFYSINYPGRYIYKQALQRKIATMIPGTGDNLGVAKSGSGSDSTGLYNVKRVAEIADTAYVIDLTNLKATKGTSEKIALRTSQKSVATAFMSAKEFKNDNLARYKEILKSRAASSPIDKQVLDAITAVTDAIKAGVGSKTIGRYDSIILGQDPKGREVKASDAASFLRSVLDNYERFVDASKNVSDHEPAKKYANALRIQFNKAKTMDYAW
jgi:hypothetical protein